MSMDLKAAVEAGSRDLAAKHWDGTGCGYHGSSACSYCYGPSPMNATEVAESVLQSALEYIDTDKATATAAELRVWAGDLLERANELDPTQTKPVRIPEPGPWGVVEASTLTSQKRCRWARESRLWHSLRSAHMGQNVTRWDDLIDPVLIREGMES